MRLASTLSLSFTLLAGALAPLHAAESLREVAPFIAINCKGPISVTVDVGQSQSVRVGGDEALVAAVKTEVLDRELTISVPDHKFSSGRGGPHVTITMPALSRVKVEGAGETLLRKVNSDRLDISYQGAGRLQASGQVKYLRLNARGVGEVDTKDLKAERVDVNFEGVGSVSVYAHDLLNAIARGMGSLEYYGHPRTVNKSVQGIGSVRAAD